MRHEEFLENTDNQVNWGLFFRGPSSTRRIPVSLSLSFPQWVPVCYTIVVRSKNLSATRLERGIFLLRTTFIIIITVINSIGRLVVDSRSGIDSGSRCSDINCERWEKPRENDLSILGILERHMIRWGRTTEVPSKTVTVIKLESQPFVQFLDS